MTFSERITAIRKDMKLSQAKFGELAYVSQRTVAFWESGDRMPSYDVLTVLADKLNVSVDWLLGRSDDKTGQQNKKPSIKDDELLNDIIARIQALPDPALYRVSDFLDGLRAGRETASVMSEASNKEAE